VNVDPFGSEVNIDFNLPAPAGRLASRVTVTPRDRNGQYLGPFWTSVVDFKSNVGTFQGPVESHLDGRYSRVLVYDRGQVPEVQVVVQDKVFPPVVVTPGCLGRLIVLVRALLKWLIALARP
jgi:hypothetical protein